MDEAKILILSLAVIILSGVILGSTYNHNEVKRYIGAGYCQTQVLGQSGYLWQKCK
jgi:hypothetical protein